MRLSNAAIGARRVKNVLKWIGVMVVGVVMIVGAVTMLNSHGKVDCGGETMRSGDQCVQVDKHGHRTTRSMDEQASDNTRTGWLLFGFGVLMIVGGGAFLVGELRRSGGSGAKTGMQVVPNPAAVPAYPVTHAASPGGGGYPAPGHAAGTGYPPPSPGYPPHPGPARYSEYPSATPHFAPSGPAASYRPGPPGYAPTAPDGTRPGYPAR